MPVVQIRINEEAAVHRILAYGYEPGPGIGREYYFIKKFKSALNANLAAQHIPLLIIGIKHFNL